MIKIDCQAHAQNILEYVQCVSHMSNRLKSLMIFTAGDNPASESYMKGKINDCHKCGIPVQQVRVANQEELMARIGLANWADNVGGIIVQLPLPEGFNEEEAVKAVQINKDVDGFKQGSPFLPCTPEGIMYLLNYCFKNELSGKTALVVGKGKLVGKPMVDLLLNAGCTVTIAHSKTTNLDDLIQRHDIIVSGVGKPKLIDLKKCKAQVVIDAGVNRDENGKLCGDCFNFDPDDGSEMKVTTVPNGVGLMTRAMLMKHMGEVQR